MPFFHGLMAVEVHGDLCTGYLVFPPMNFLTPEPIELIFITILAVHTNYCLCCRWPAGTLWMGVIARWPRAPKWELILCLRKAPKAIKCLAGFQVSLGLIVSSGKFITLLQVLGKRGNDVPSPVTPHLLAHFFVGIHSLSHSTLC